MKVTNRRLHGLLRGCGLDNCTCLEVVIVEEWIEGSVAHSEDVWIGTWAGDPAPMEEQALLDELEAACRKHRMTQDSFDPGEWERFL